MQAYTFTLKNKKGQLNKALDALSRRLLTIHEIQVQSIGIDSFKDMYPNDNDFAKAYKVCQDFENNFLGSYADFTLQDGLLFRGG